MPSKKKSLTRSSTALTTEQKLSYLVVILISFALAFVLIRPFVNVIFLSITFALVLRPVYNYFRYRLRQPNWLSITVTIFLSVLLIIIPVVLLLSSLYHEIADLVISFNPRFDGAYVDSTIEYVNQLIDTIPAVDYTLDKVQIVVVLKEGVQLISRGVFSSIVEIGQGVIGFITSAFIFFFVLIATLPKQPQLRRLIEKLSPLKLADTKLYLTRANTIIVDTIRGSLVIAVVQASLGTAFLFFTGIENLTLLFFLMLLMSLLPVIGTAFVTIPIGIYFILTGNIVTGVLLILWQLLVMSIIDNVLRPMLVSDDSNIPVVFMLLGILGGISLLGPMGVIYGPLFMVLFLTAVEIAQQRRLFR